MLLQASRATKSLEGPPRHHGQAAEQPLAAEAAGLDGVEDRAARAALAHKVKGAALVIGARGLALAAEKAGKGAAGGGYQAALAETCAAIDAMLAAGRFVPGEA